MSPEDWEMNDSVGTGTFCQARGPEFDLWDPLDRQKEPTPQNCSLTPQLSLDLHSQLQ